MVTSEMDDPDYIASEVKRRCLDARICLPAVSLPLSGCNRQTHVSTSLQQSSVEEEYEEDHHASISRAIPRTMNPEEIEKFTDMLRGRIKDSEQLLQVISYSY